MSHFDQLASYVPGLAGKRILDLGSGKGGFLISLAKRGIRAKGLEYSAAYIKETRAEAKQENVEVDVVEGRAEALPFPDESFDVINACEVIEHVQSPQLMLQEMHRVLAPGGCAYVSVPNRFGMKDQHFHLYAVNWLPRAWSDAFIGIFGTHKNYEDESAGNQRLQEMHYYTYTAVCALMRSAGFSVQDIRALRIQKEYTGLKKLLASLAYPIVRAVYFDSFHLLLSR